MTPTPRLPIGTLLGVCLAALVLAERSSAQELEDVLGGLGTAESVDGAVSEEAQRGEGTVTGQIFDRETGAPVPGVTVILEWPDTEEGDPRQEIRTTDADGAFEFVGVAAGHYDISFVKSGYRASTMTRFEVAAGELNRADFPLSPVAAGTGDQVLDLEAFVVEASAVSEMMNAIELRLDSDQMLNILGAEDLSKFAASDVAEALKRVAGVNIVEGQFAIIRGLEDRYSSTLYNGAPVPSPDPDKQSVQLDLFPSDVVGNLVVAKTFAPDLPSNSSGGSIDILTHQYPELDEGETVEIKLSGGSGFNDRAIDRFLKLSHGSPTGREADGGDVIESDIGGSVAGRRRVGERELRFKGVVNREVDYTTGEGSIEAKEPLPTRTFRNLSDGAILESGGLSLGELNLSNGNFDLTDSVREKQWTGYLGLGFDLDTEGNHKIDASAFYTKKEEEVVQLKENGYLPNFDYSSLAALQANGDEILPQEYNGFATLGSWIARSVRNDANDAPSRGPLWFTTFFESESFDRERELRVFQANGDHRFDAVPGLRLTWAANQAKTTQEDAAFGARYFFEPATIGAPPSSFPSTLDNFGAGEFVANSGIFLSDNDIEENQDFARIDLEYERSFGPDVTVEMRAGGWWERAKRGVDSGFLESPSVRGVSQFAILSSTQRELGTAILDALDRSGNAISGLRATSNDSERKIVAWNLGVKATIRDRLDLLAGLRREDISIESNNDPFTGEVRFGAPEIFPTRFLFFDRLDNPSNGEVFPAPSPDTVFNDQILGISVPVGQDGFVDLTDAQSIEALVNGEIDETKTLPSFGITYRPIEGLQLRGAYSRTVARPSFREMGYYVSVEPGSDDLVVGNPQLQLSDVESFDTRLEYTWGTTGDLFALSGFVKTIEDPIESIVVRNPLNLEFDSTALFRTFFNNPSDADLWGVEVEGRKTLRIPGVEFSEFFSAGGNFTYIDAEVDRSEAELARAAPFFGLAPGDTKQFSGLKQSRRLFGQPEWIANADLSFDHPDWGTKATLAFFAISDVLDAAGSANIGPNGQVLSFTIDRYVDSFHQLDFVWSQKIWRGLTFKMSVKNLTDSRRKIIYDRDQTRGEIAERAQRFGRDYSFSLSYGLRF